MRYEGALRSPIYDLCRQTVTVYHACYNPFRVTRCVIHGAYFERKTVQTVDKSGGKSCDEFLLVIPNKNARRAAPALFNGIPGGYVLECGDRIVEGVGEEITECRDIYALAPPGCELGRDFINAASPRVERQILRAGYRLAKVLNDLFG